MKILQKWEFEDLMKEFPDGGIVFAEYEPDVLKSVLMVTDGDFGAREVIPRDGEVFDFDWNKTDVTLSNENYITKITK